MFQLDEFVVHNTGGICQIKKIAPLDIPGADVNRKYYFLVPIKPNKSKVFVPVDNSDVMRKVISDVEARDFIKDIPNIEEMQVDNEKQRENLYREAIKSTNLRELVKVMKNLQTRKLKRLSEGKKSTATDDKYMKIAEENLFEELSFVLGREKRELQDSISL